MMRAETSEKELKAAVTDLLNTLKGIKDKPTALASLDKMKELDNKIRGLSYEITPSREDDEAENGPSIGLGRWGNFFEVSERENLDCFNEWRRLLMADFYDCPQLEETLDGLFVFAIGNETKAKVNRAIAKLAVEFMSALSDCFSEAKNVTDKESADEYAKKLEAYRIKSNAVDKEIKDKKLPDEELSKAIRKYCADFVNLTMHYSFKDFERIEENKFYGSEKLKEQLKKLVEWE